MSKMERVVEYSLAIAMKVGEVVLDALDCFGDDPLEDAELRSGIWDKD